MHSIRTVQRGSATAIGDRLLLRLQNGSCRRCFRSTPLVPSKKNATTKEQVEHMRQRIMQTNNNKDNLAATAWDSLWQEGVTPWDLGGPTKALISELQRQRPILERTLIPGCGSGHDLMSLARYLDDDGLEENNNDTHHATIVGLEISRTSLQHAQQVVEESMERNGPLSQKTTIELYEGDFFAVPSTWKRVYTTSATATMDDDTTSKQLPENTSSFDFIFDYTFFCAIPPNLRSDWGQQISSRLLSRPHGQLLTFMFPYAATNPKPNDSPAAGPPFPVSLKDYRQALPWLLLQTPYPYASIDTVAARQGQEVMGWWSFPPPSSKLGAANTTYCTYTHTSIPLPHDVGETMSILVLKGWRSIRSRCPFSSFGEERRFLGESSVGSY